MGSAVLIRPPLGHYYRRNVIQAAVTVSPPLNLALLAAVLERAGHRVHVLDLEVDPTLPLGATLARLAPDLVGVTFRTPQWDEARHIGRVAANAVPRALRVAGGPHATAMGDAVVAEGTFQVAVRGEGEEALEALATGSDPAGVPGVWHRGGRTADRPLVRDLDALPLPAWHLFDLRRYQRRSLVAPVVPVADLETSRGCPAACAWCTKGVFGRGFRPWSADGAVRGVRHALESGFRAFNLVDDAFSTQADRAMDFCRGLLDQGLRAPWSCTNGLRVDGVDASFFRLAARAGCWLVAFGIESADETLLQGLGKRTSLTQARNAVRDARAAGILTIGYFLLGLPGETESHVEETIRLACSLDLDLAKFSLAMPLPGTALWEAWRPHMKDPAFTAFNIHQPQPDWFTHPSLPWSVLERARRRAWRSFYGRPGHVLRTVRRFPVGRLCYGT